MKIKIVYVNKNSINQFITLYKYTLLSNQNSVIKISLDKFYITYFTSMRLFLDLKNTIPIT